MSKLYPTLALVFLSFILPAAARCEAPKTVAESSDYQATSTHADVISFCDQLAKEAPLVRLGTLGTSVEGRKLPLVIVADPPIATADEAARSKKLVVFVIGNIHAGEVDGKEALLMLARDIALAKEKPLLKDLILVFAPIFNADGNEKFSKTNRTTQAGPPEVGIRANAQGFDLNRDFVKLESPEVKAFVRFVDKWDPAVFIDCHTTNGSFHRYTMTYEGGAVPAGDKDLITFVREEMLPDVSLRLEKNDKFRSYFYGSFSADRSLWETVPATPRYSTHYIGLRNRIGILSESYTYAPFKERVLGSKAFVRNILEYTVDNKDKIRKLLEDARAKAVKAGKDLAAADKIPLQYKSVPVGRPYELLGYVEATKDGKRVATTETKSYPVRYNGGTETTLAVRRPYAYLIPPAFANVKENLQRHGIDMDELREDLELEVEAYKIDKITRKRAFQKHQPVSLTATMRKEKRKIEAGSLLVKTAQPLGPMAAYFLEPQSMDGLATWNFFDTAIAEGKDFPVVRLMAQVPMTTGKPRPLAETRVMNKPITFETLYGDEGGGGGAGGGRGRGGRGGPIDFNGAPVIVLSWLDDGEHYLQVREGRVHKVHARTGRSEPYLDVEKITQSLATIPGVEKTAATNLARSPNLRFTPQKTQIVVEHEGNVYLCPLDGGKATQVTESAAGKQMVTFSPDGKSLAFVRANNLFVVDVATRKERALTTDGSAVIYNGKADWVYLEEVFDRKNQGQSFWWSPDSTALAFIRYDDTPVQKYELVNNVPTVQVIEPTTYPKAGSPNPLVKVGIVAVDGGSPRWVEMADYAPKSILIVRAGWWPDSQSVYFYVQDRAQTWLDFCTVDRNGGSLKKLFRETTKAWVEDHGPPLFLKDGTFLLTNAHSGYVHLYHHDKDGKVIKALTSGDWEMTTGPFQSHPVELVDETNGWVYFTGKKDNPIGSNLYRVNLDGSKLERLTRTEGDHRVKVSPKGNLFIDSWSSHSSPTKVKLYQTDGAAVRTLDTNPVYGREEYLVGKYEMVHIKTPDGFVLEGSLLLPPNFDANKRYPVWTLVYGGPHMPQVHDNWGGGRLHDEMLAQRGFVVFHVDPRSASGKGNISAWACYKQLGVQEVKDLETAAKWLAEIPWIDPARIGISGTSYGGFMAAYTLTHSKLYAAGIAGAAVTDWKNYDTIYTERFMLTPQENPAGYRAGSVVQAAANLHGKLLIVHGLMDDNVHAQNAIQLIGALQRADKDFETSFYPLARHGGFTPRHYQRTTLDFMTRALKP